MGFISWLPSLARLYVSSFLLALAGAGAQTILSPPGQPSHQGVTGGFELIGNSYVSAQQVSVLELQSFLCSRRIPSCSWARPTRYILLIRSRTIQSKLTDIQHGHPVRTETAHPSRLLNVFGFLEWSLGANSQRAMDAITNTFCAVSFATYALRRH
jgi:hypothetical protein